jgi:hypothetical protein
MPLIASQLSRVELDDDRVISAGTLHVLGILVSNATISDVEVVFKNNAAAPILNIAVPAHDSVEFSAQWMADKGLNVASLGDANVVVTVAHGAEGA